MTNDPADVSFAAGLWWRQSKIIGAKCVPAILLVSAGRLRLSSADEVALDAATNEVTASFSRFGTLTLQSGGHKYDVVGRAASMSPKFTDAQLIELRQLQAELDGGAGTGWNAQAFDINAQVANMAPWRSVLPAAGVRVT
jgi:hypothetical protein